MEQRFDKDHESMNVMIVVVFWVVIGLALYAAVRGRQPSLQSVDELEKLTVPVDIDAFSSLMSDDLSRFMATKLRADDQRTAKKMRNRAAIGYVSAMASNAALLIRATEIAKLSTDPSVREQATGLQMLAIKLRVLSLLTLLKLSIEHLLPITIQWHRLVVDYGAFKESVQFLTMAVHARRMSPMQET